MRNHRNRPITLLDKTGKKVGELRRDEAARLIANGAEAVTMQGTTKRYLTAVRETASSYLNTLDTIISK